MAAEDRAVPRDQGWEYYRAMQQVGKAPVRFLWFPGQPHGLLKVTHQLRKMNEEIAWFDRFLFNTFKPENEAFAEESPLARVLEIDKASGSSWFVWGATTGYPASRNGNSQEGLYCHFKIRTDQFTV